MIFQKTENDKIYTISFQIEQTESCIDIRDRVFNALWPDLSIRQFNLRFRHNDKIITDLKTPLMDVVDCQDAVIKCDILQITELKVWVYPIVETGEAVEISIITSDSVMNLKRDIATRLLYNIDDFLLFFEFEWLNEETFIYQYDIKDNSMIKYVLLLKIEDFQQVNPEAETGEHSVSFNAKMESTGEEIRIKRYKSSSPFQGVENYKPMIREIVSFIKIGDNSRFVQLKAFYIQGKEFFLGLELMKENLHDFVAKSGPLQESIIARFAKQILEALEEMNEHHIYHCYLNSYNILLDENQQIKISGFSLSRFFAGMTCDDMLEGFTVSKKPPTPNFSAPEIICTGISGLKSDIWSFGAVVVEMVTGKIPFYDWTENDMTDKIANNGTIPFEAPNLEQDSSLRKLIDFCLKKDMDDRPTPRFLLDHFAEYFSLHDSS